jgi:hypothetical protein
MLCSIVVFGVAGIFPILRTEEACAVRPSMDIDMTLSGHDILQWTLTLITLVTGTGFYYRYINAFAVYESEKRYEKVIILVFGVFLYARIPSCLFSS